MTFSGAGRIERNALRMVRVLWIVRQTKPTGFPGVKRDA